MKALTVKTLKEHKSECDGRLISLSFDQEVPEDAL